MRAMLVGCAALAAGTVGCVGESDVALGKSGAAALVGGWSGYIENTAFPSGSDAIAVDFASGDGSEVTGTVVFGAGPMLPPPTNPDVGYPPGVNPYLSADRSAYWSPGPREGFAYTIASGSLDDARLRFHVRADEFFEAWCALQTPILDGFNHEDYACIPNAVTRWGETCGIDPDKSGPAPEEPIDCGKLALCLPAQAVCACDASGCSAHMQDGELPFDLAVEADHAEGSMGNARVRLFRE